MMFWFLLLIILIGWAAIIFYTSLARRLPGGRGVYELKPLPAFSGSSCRKMFKQW